jgi:hypothetical protein
MAQLVPPPALPPTNPHGDVHAAVAARPAAIPGRRLDPEVVIQQAGRWTWRVYIRHGIIQYGPDGYGWHVFGQQRAERKARRELDRYLERQRRSAAVHVVARGEEA